MTYEPTCHFCPRPAVHIIQGRHVCDDQYCKYNAWQLEPKEQEIPSTYDEALAWLNERVGKTVYRGPVWPEAVGPYLSNPAAIYITDKWHAQYLHDYAIECGVRYFDEPQK